MGEFQCRVITPQGKRLEVQKTALNREVLIMDFSRQGYTILSLDEVETKSQNGKNQKLKPASVLDFTRTMSLLLSSGLQLKDSLRVSKDIFTQLQTKQFLNAVSDQVEKGQSLAQALDPFQTSLGTLYLGLIKIGEKTSTLAPIFERLTEYLAVQKQLKDKLTSALMYPLLVLSVAFIGIIFLAAFIFPALSELVGSLRQGNGSEIQRNLTSFQIQLSVIGTLLVLCGAAFITLGYFSKRNVYLKNRLGRLLWRLPLVGKVVQTLEGLNFCFAMETLIQAGYSAEISLGEASASVKNAYFRIMISAVKDRILRGQSFSQAMESQTHMPQRLTTWVKVGEQSGDLTKVFGQLRFYYQQDWEKITSRLMNLMEPLLILSVGIILIFLILNFITPVFSMLGDLL